MGRGRGRRGADPGRTLSLHARARDPSVRSRPATVTFCGWLSADLCVRDLSFVCVPPGLGLGPSGHRRTEGRYRHQSGAGRPLLFKCEIGPFWRRLLEEIWFSEPCGHRVVVKLQSRNSCQRAYFLCLFWSEGMEIISVCTVLTLLVGDAGMKPHCGERSKIRSEYHRASVFRGSYGQPESTKEMCNA